jgi:hypothetical protein
MNYSLNDRFSSRSSHEVVRGKSGMASLQYAEYAYRGNPSRHPDLRIIPPKQAQKECETLVRSLWTGELGHRLLALINLVTGQL